MERSRERVPGNAYPFARDERQERYGRGIPFFCFMEHPAQSPQCTVGVRCRAVETERLHIVLCYVIQAHADDFRHRKQPSAGWAISLPYRVGPRMHKTKGSEIQA